MTAINFTGKTVILLFTGFQEPEAVAIIIAKNNHDAELSF